MKKHVTYFLVTFDSTLKFLNVVLKASFFQTLHRIQNEAPPLIERPGYSHSFPPVRTTGTHCTLVSLLCLQLVQNAAARLLTGTQKRDHITPAVASLDWPTVGFRDKGSPVEP